MSDSVLAVLPATIVIISLSAFFVAVEFALMAAKRHRLEDAAATSRSARAALRSSNELTLLLAGSQLGITLCTLALGAITKPAVHHWLTPALVSLGLSPVVADVAAFLLALFIVTFLHLVIGEMAPKSWAIAHPERSAILLALPMRAFMAVTRPLLAGLNRTANALVRAAGVDPDSAQAGQRPEDLRHLVEHSVNVGALDASYSAAIAGALDMQVTRLADLVDPNVAVAWVPEGATADQVQEASRATGHRRILLGPPGAHRGVIHVRETLLLAPDADVSALATPAFTLSADCMVHAALAAMRRTGNHLALVTPVASDDPAVLGVISLPDVLRRLLGLADETVR